MHFSAAAPITGGTPFPCPLFGDSDPVYHRVAIATFILRCYQTFSPAGFSKTGQVRYRRRMQILADWAPKLPGIKNELIGDIYPGSFRRFKYRPRIILVIPRTLGRIKACP